MGLGRERRGGGAYSIHGRRVDGVKHEREGKEGKRERGKDAEKWERDGGTKKQGKEGRGACNWKEEEEALNTLVQGQTSERASWNTRGMKISG